MVDHSSRCELWPEPGSEDGTRCRPWRDAARDQIHCPCVARPTDDQLPEETSSQAVSRKDRACRLIWLVHSQLGGSEPRSRAVNVITATPRPESSGGLSDEKPCCGRKPGSLSGDECCLRQTMQKPWEELPPNLPTEVHDRRFHRGTFRRCLKLFRMTIQQDPFEPDRWWFAPLLYAGAALMIAAIVLA